RGAHDRQGARALATDLAKRTRREPARCVGRSRLRVALLYRLGRDALPIIRMLPTSPAPLLLRLLELRTAGPGCRRTLPDSSARRSIVAPTDLGIRGATGDIAAGVPPLAPNVARP